MDAGLAVTMAEIDIDLPEPVFTGTPKDLATPNLEPPQQMPRPTLAAPKGTENRAFRKPVSGAMIAPRHGEYRLVTDGNKEAQPDSFVELAPGVQHVQVDLGASHVIHGIAVWHYHLEPRVYFDVIVQISKDPDFISGVETVFNNDHDSSAGLGIGDDQEYIETHKGKLIPVDSVEGRYVRLYTNGNTANDLNHYTEVEVYATEAP